MTEIEPITPPERTDMHDALNVFLGEWRAEGWSYGSPEQREDDPKGARDKWVSTHSAKWYTGEFFLVQDERANLGAASSSTFDTLSVMGIDPRTNEYFARTFENHGFFRLYKVKKDGATWSLHGPTERARIEFNEDGTKQVITWEWMKDGKWLPLCDRVATKS